MPPSRSGAVISLIFGMGLLSFKACSTDFSCENGCSQLRWRCFAICHKISFLTLLHKKHQIDLNFLRRDGSYFQEQYFSVFSLLHCYFLQEDIGEAVTGKISAVSERKNRGFMFM